MSQPWYSGPWRHVRLRILQRDRYICQLALPGCRVSADRVDHIIRPEDGGPWWDDTNLQAACRPCNTTKAYRGRTPPPAHGIRTW